MSSRQMKSFGPLIADLLASQGWKHVRQEPHGQSSVDIIAEWGNTKYVIEVKQSAEGRRDRLIPLLSQAVLQAKAAAHESNKAIPVAVVAAPHISEVVADQLKDFAMKYAADVGIGIVDSSGFRYFQGYGLERLNANRVSGRANWLSYAGRARAQSPQLFSNLNQWMLKLLLAPRIADEFLSASRERYQSGSQLAKAAGVSVMSASRFIRQLSIEGFLEQHSGCLHLVRIEQLMQRWVGANVKSRPDIPARWLIRGGREQLPSALKAYIAWQESAKPNDKPLDDIARNQSPLICVRGFAAAHLLGLGFVHGAVPELYLERLDPLALNELGLSLDCDPNVPDVLIRIPANADAVFRPLVMKGGVPVSDIVQVWLDVSPEPARGKEQAAVIWKRALGPSILQEKHAR